MLSLLECITYYNMCVLGMYYFGMFFVLIYIYIVLYYNMINMFVDPTNQWWA